MSIRHFIAAAFTVLSLAAPTAWAAVEANQASQAELETVKGIGPGLSGKIIAARQQSSFKDWSDLVDRVGGVGPGNAARFSQAGLTVAGAAYSAPAAAPAERAAKPAAEPQAKAKADPKADPKAAQR